MWWNHEHKNKATWVVFWIEEVFGWAPSGIILRWVPAGGRLLRVARYSWEFQPVWVSWVHNTKSSAISQH